MSERRTGGIPPDPSHWLSQTYYARQCWLAEYGLLAFTAVALWGKLVWFSLSLRSDGWSLETPLVDWMNRYPDLFCATIASVLLMLCVVPLLPRRARPWILLAFDLYVTTLIVVNSIHVRYYGEVASVSGLTLAHQLIDVQSSVVQQLKWFHAIYFLDVLIVAMAFPVMVRRYPSKPCVVFGHRARVSGGMLLAGVLFALPTARVVWMDENGQQAFTNLQRGVCARIGLLAYHVRDVGIQFCQEPPIDEATMDRVRRFLDNEQREKGMASALFGVAKGRNLIMTDAESLQAFTIGLELEGQPVTPRFTAFATECLNFVNFHDQTHLGTSSDAEFSALQSLHPSSAQYVISRFAGNRFRALPTILADHGYRTVAAVASTPQFWNREQMHPRLGLQRSFFENEYKISERIGPWLADHEFFRQTVPILQGQSEPFAATMMTASNHDPFELPRKYATLKLGEWEGTLLGRYLQSVHYFDWAFGQFVDQLRTSGLLDRSVFVVYADHQAFLDSDEIARLLGNSQGSEFERFVVHKKLPMFIRLPNGEHASVQRACGGHLDIAPTVLSLLGVDIAGEVMLGSDLTKGRDSLVVFRNGSFADGKHYFINHFGPIENCACFAADSGERVVRDFPVAQRKRAIERLEISDLILRGDMIPSLSAKFGVADPSADLRVMAVQPVKGAPAADKPVLRLRVRYCIPECREVRFVWGLNNFTYVPANLPPGTFLTLNNSHMNTPMQREGNAFVLDFEVEEGMQLNYAFTAIRDVAGEAVELWKGADAAGSYYARNLTAPDVDESGRAELGAGR